MLEKLVCFWDLTDYLDDYPNLKENIEPFKNSMTYGGQIIGIPRRTLGRVGGMLLREDWLENLNLEEPKTLDDFTMFFMHLHMMIQMETV